MNYCICGGYFWHVGFWGETLLCLRFFLLLFCVCMPYGIFSVTLLVLCHIQILHVVNMMLCGLADCELLFLLLVCLTVCGCNQILQICAGSLIGGDKLFIV